MLKELELRLKRNMKTNLKEKKGGIFYPFFKCILIFIFPLIILDIFFFIFIKSKVDVDILCLILCNIGYALLFYGLYLLFDKIGYILSIIFIFLFSIYYILEIILYNTYGMFMPLRFIFGNVHSVTVYYFDETISVISNNILLCIFILLLVFIYVYISYRILFMHKKNDKKQIKYSKKIILLLFGIILVLLSVHFANFTRNYTFDVSKYGLKISLYNGIFDQKEKRLVLDNKEGNNEFVETKKDELNDYNVLNIDFKALNQSETRDNFKNINNYVASLKPSKKNEYTGIFNGKNLVLICAEAYSHYILDKELTPTLYRLTNNGFRFNDFYVPSWGGSTSSGEYAFLTGLIPDKIADTMARTIDKNMCFTLPSTMKRYGYNTSAFHNGNYMYYNRYLTHNKNLGFDNFYATGNGIENITRPWPTDIDVIEGIFDKKCLKEPFCLYFMTMSGHAFYNDPNSYKVKKYLERVIDRFKDTFPEQINYYLCAQLYLEDMMKILIEKLEENGMLDSTVICLVADHYPYGLQSSAFTGGYNYLPILYGKEDLDEFDIDRNMPILWSLNLENEYNNVIKDIDTPTSVIDIVPTLLNLFGCKFDSRLFPGRDVFSDVDPIVIYNNGAFIIKEGKYSKLKQKFISNNDEKFDDNFIDNFKKMVENKILYSVFAVDNDYFNYIFAKENTYKDLCEERK